MQFQILNANIVSWEWRDKIIIEIDKPSPMPNLHNGNLVLQIESEAWYWEEYCRKIIWVEPNNISYI